MLPSIFGGTLSIIIGSFSITGTRIGYESSIIVAMGHSGIVSSESSSVVSDIWQEKRNKIQHNILRGKYIP